MTETIIISIGFLLTSLFACNQWMINEKLMDEIKKNRREIDDLNSYLLNRIKRQK